MYSCWIIQRSRQDVQAYLCIHPLVRAGMQGLVIKMLRQHNAAKRSLTNSVNPLNLSYQVVRPSWWGVIGHQHTKGAFTPKFMKWSVPKGKLLLLQFFIDSVSFHNWQTNHTLKTKPGDHASQPLIGNKFESNICEKITREQFRYWIPTQLLLS